MRQCLYLKELGKWKDRKHNYRRVTAVYYRTWRDKIPVQSLINVCNLIRRKLKQASRGAARSVRQDLRGKYFREWAQRR